MTKVNIIKPTERETLAVLTAFNADGNTYIVFDSERVGSMGLPIIYVSKFNLDKLEKISDTNEWQSVKNFLKGIINGTNFHYIKVANELKADEAFYMPLTLPDASFQIIKNRYVVSPEEASSSDGPLVMEENSSPTPESSNDIPNPPSSEQVVPNSPVEEKPIESSFVQTPEVSTNPEKTNEPIIPNVPNTVEPEVQSNPTILETPAAPVTEPSSTESVPEAPISEQPIVEAKPIEQPPVEQPPVSNVAPVMPSENASSNTIVNNNPITTEPNNLEAPTPKIETSETTVEKEIKSNLTNFINEKETFLSACANMFDALASKYQNMYEELKKKEQELEAKEIEINEKLKNANEHLANAEAREQVANIAHDNAQKIMDITNLMPKNPNVETGVI